MSGTVLVLDDSLTVRMDLAEAFDAAGFRALRCGTAAQAREVLAREAVDVVILDVVLPDIDGVEFLRELRADPERASIAVLMLSSESEVKDRIRGLRTGADEYVGKPYDTGYVLARARQLIAARTETDTDTTTILVIDDSTTFREDLRSECEAAGYTVLTAATGDEGLRIAAERRPNAIVVDGVLPRMDGATVIRHIRLDGALRSTPCLLLTASDEVDVELRALDAGADAFVRKAEDLDVLMAKLRAILRVAAHTTAHDDTESLLGPKKILAVDDSPTYLNELATSLRGNGYDVVLARSGEEALQFLAVEPVDCILLDLVMPGLDGQATCRRIKAAPAVRDVPLIMLTALEDREAMIDALGAGADDYIPKSSELAVLTARVRAQIRRKQFEDENRRMREELLRTEIEATEARAARELAEARAALVTELQRKNEELESFDYSVSHDLRAPVRAIIGFSEALLEDQADRLDVRGKDYLNRVSDAARRMRDLIDDLLELSRMGRAELHREHVDVTAIARGVAVDLANKEPDRDVRVRVSVGLAAEADGRLIRIALENLMGNAWKFTARVPEPSIEVSSALVDGETVFEVRDNGGGFDMRYSDKLFRPFQRLHADTDVPGTGIGLATVQRIIHKHGGRVWADSTPGAGTRFCFTVPPGDRRDGTGGRP